MARFSDGEYEFDSAQEESLARGRWEARLMSAYNGKRGQRILRDLEAALLAMPEKRLIAGHLSTPNGDCCTVGLYCAAKQAEANGTDVHTEAVAMAEGWFEEDWEEGDDTDEDYGAEETVEAGVAAGMTRTMAYELAYWNDAVFDYTYNRETRQTVYYTPEERWAKMLDYVQKRIIRPAAAGVPAGE